MRLEEYRLKYDFLPLLRESFASTGFNDHVVTADILTILSWVELGALDYIEVNHHSESITILAGMKEGGKARPSMYMHIAYPFASWLPERFRRRGVFRLVRRQVTVTISVSGSGDGPCLGALPKDWRIEEILSPPNSYRSIYFAYRRPSRLRTACRKVLGSIFK